MPALFYFFFYICIYTHKKKHTPWKQHLSQQNNQRRWVLRYHEHFQIGVSFWKMMTTMNDDDDDDDDDVDDDHSLSHCKMWRGWRSCFPSSLPAEEWLRLTLLETLSSSCANMLSLPQGSMLQVALRTQGVAAGVQPDCFFLLLVFFFSKGKERKERE